MAPRPPAPADAGVTAYAVLGLLALRPWTPYELTQQFRRSLRFCWPVSERAVYSEPERLVAAGFATVSVAQTGRRVRRTYSITPAGRRALRAWLRTEPEPPRFQLEAVLRLLFADAGDVAELVASVRALRRDLADLGVAGVDTVAPYLDGAGPFPERAHIVALFSDLYVSLTEVIDDWAERAIAEVASWPDTRGVGMTDAARTHLERTVEAGARWRAQLAGGEL